jgi:LPPG:FO 2-phospho-L-lactate transferase
MPALRMRLERTAAPVIAVSPLIGGKAIKGPTAKLMAELGVEQSAAAIAAHYSGLIDGFVLDQTDDALTRRIGLPATTAQTMMRTLDDRTGLAKKCLAFAAQLSGGETKLPAQGGGRS